MKENVSRKYSNIGKILPNITNRNKTLKEGIEELTRKYSPKVIRTYKENGKEIKVYETRSASN